MKKAVSLFVILGFLVLTCGLSFAAWFGKENAPVASVAKPVSKTAEVIANKKTELNGKEWKIEIRPAGASSKSKAEEDVVSFAEEKVVSKNLSTQGYAPTNFSVRLENDGTVIWETMQVAEKSGTIFWRGDIGPDGIMRGVLSKRDLKGNVKDFNFVSVTK